MTEITPAYIAAITKEELEAEGYRFTDLTPEGKFGRWSVEWGDGDEDSLFGLGFYPDVIVMAQIHYAPRKMLREVQQRNAALEALVREAYAQNEFDNQHKFTARQVGWSDEEQYYAMTDDWRERAAKLLEGTE